MSLCLPFEPGLLREERIYSFLIGVTSKGKKTCSIWEQILSFKSNPPFLKGFYCSLNFLSVKLSVQNDKYFQVRSNFIEIHFPQDLLYLPYLHQKLNTTALQNQIAPIKLLDQGPVVQS